jgi:hypothetical protein
MVETASWKEPWGLPALAIIAEVAIRDGAVVLPPVSIACRAPEKRSPDRRRSAGSSRSGSQGGVDRPGNEYALLELWRRVRHEASLYPEIEYAFKHALTQEVVYQSQLSDRRARTHAAVAEAIVGGDPEKLDERAALIAHHWEQAGENLQAATWHARAADWAGVRDPGEAMKHWRRVRALLESLPESDGTTGPSLMSRVQLLALGWRQGLTEDDAAAFYTEGDALARRTGNVYLHAMLKLACVLSLGGRVDECRDGRHREALGEETWGFSSP